MKRAGKDVPYVSSAAVASDKREAKNASAQGVKAQPQAEGVQEVNNTKKSAPTVSRAKVEEAPPATPEPQAQARGGISSLLGAWWGRS